MINDQERYEGELEFCSWYNKKHNKNISPKQVYIMLNNLTGKSREKFVNEIDKYNNMKIEEMKNTWYHIEFND
jgi:hypothetical protein